MERKFKQEVILEGEGAYFEGFLPAEKESPYWKYLRGEGVSQEVLDNDPIYRIMRVTPKGEER
jgi:hypothetical protein